MKDTNADPHIAFLQIRPAILGQGLPSPAILLFNHPIRGSLSVINRTPVDTINDDDHYESSVERQERLTQNNDTLRNYNFIPTGSTVALQ